MIDKIPDGVILADGLEDAFIGIGMRCGQPDVAVYDYDKILEILMMRDGMPYDDAVEYAEFNVVDGWHGPVTPVWMHRIASEEKDRND
tara:strand:+ start:831 stop:1094 length:264 start_codon:yes stop_codon:yes gene_type:complete